MGVNHMLVDMWDTILTDLDSGGSASCIISLDFEKPLNRLNHDECIKALQLHEASNKSLSLVHTFLKNRTMQAGVGGSCPALVAQGVSARRTGHILEALLPQGELRE